MMTEPYIELNAFLKVKNLATSGGQAKVLIRSGAVLVNNVPETRNRRKLVVGDHVSYNEKMYTITSDLVRLHVIK